MSKENELSSLKTEIKLLEQKIASEKQRIVNKHVRDYIKKFMPGTGKKKKNRNITPKKKCRK